MPIGPAAWSARARPRMIPVIVDPKQVAIALVGRGSATERRLELLFEAGAERLSRLFGPAVARARGPRRRALASPAARSRRI